ncbi:hypothetical protein ACLX1H_008865 [Fusarium chlamydosporum]
MHLYQSLKTATCIQSRSKPSCHVEIDIGGHTESKIYTTGSKIQGSVKLTAHHQTAFHSIQVDLRGTTTTRQAFQYGTPFTTHTFMQIRMPISEAVLPACQILEAGKVYNIPFLFIIPTDLSPKACNHQNTTVRERHLLLPPTIGAWKTKDLTDGSISVDYVIRARLVLEKDDRGKERFVDHGVSLKVIPVFPEQPPIHISSPNSQYCFRDSKSLNCSTQVDDPTSGPPSGIRISTSDRSGIHCNVTQKHATRNAYQNSGYRGYNQLLAGSNRSLT